MIGLKEPVDARERLEELVALYRRGCLEPLPLFESSSWEFAKVSKLAASALDDGLPSTDEAIEAIQKGLKAALNKWDVPGDGRGDVDDPHVARVFEGRPPLEDPAGSPVRLSLEFARAALTMWGPVSAARVTKGPTSKWFLKDDR
jgi:exonuclease V gamma subunit